MEGSSVKLYVYDLSGGMAKSMSMPLVGKQIDGIWCVSFPFKVRLDFASLFLTFLEGIPAS